jgi:hypothetical protein
MPQDAPLNGGAGDDVLQGPWPAGTGMDDHVHDPRRPRPIPNQVTASGTHIHHSVPGIILLIIGAFTAVGGPGALG